MNPTFRNVKTVLASFLAVCAVASCNLIPDTNPPDTTPTYTAPPTPSIGDGSGMMSAVKTVTYQDVPGVGQIEINIGIAAATFFNGTDYNTFISGGTVTCEGLELPVNDNGSYTFIPTSSEPEGVDFSGNPNWTVSGNATIPSFTHDCNIGFPTVGDINSSTTVTAANGYTLSVASVSGADSVIYMVGGVAATVAGNLTSHTFSAADLANIGTGASMAQAAAYKLESAQYGGKTFYFVTESVVTKSVTLE